MATNRSDLVFNFWSVMPDFYSKILALLLRVAKLLSRFFLVDLKFLDHCFWHNEVTFVDVLDYKYTSDCEVIRKKLWTTLWCKEPVKRQNSKVKCSVF